MALANLKREFIITRSGIFLDCRQKVEQVAGTSLSCKSKCQRKSSDIWSWAPALSQAFPKSTFDELLPGYQFCQFPPEPHRVCFMEMSSARTAITGTAITGTMQNGSNSGESENRQSSLGTENKAIFAHLPSTQPSGLNYRRVWGWLLKGWLLRSSAPNQLGIDGLQREDASLAPWKRTGRGDPLWEIKITQKGGGASTWEPAENKSPSCTVQPGARRSSQHKCTCSGQKCSVPWCPLFILLKPFFSNNIP